jgi:hypothetical protein
VPLWKSLTPLAAAAVLVVSGCAQKPSVEKQSLFDIAHVGVEKKVCTLAPYGSIELAFPSITSYLKGVTPTIEETPFPSAGTDARTVSCFYETSAGPVTLSVVRGTNASQSMLNNPGVSFKFKGVSFVPLSLAEGIAVETASDEVVFLSAPGLVPRSSLIEAARLVVLPSKTTIPDLPLPVGVRTHVDVFRTSIALDVCAKQVELSAPAASTAPDPAFSSRAAGMVDITPRADADAYSLATLKRAMRATGVTWDATTLRVGETSVPLTCDSATAAIWGFIWDDPTSATPSSGPLTIDEISKIAVSSNAWRVLLMISSSKPAVPSRTPASPDVSYDVTRTSTP